MTRLGAFALIAGTLLASAPALAQQLEPATLEPSPSPAPATTPADEVESAGLAVSGTTKTGAHERIPEAAAQVTVLSAREIAVFGHRTLADLVENVPESFVGGERSYPILGLRGIARAGDFNTRVLVLLDGHTLNEPWNNYAPAGTDLPLDLTQVERVEILAGPVSALYGSNAFFGAVHVVTRRPERRIAGASITGGARYGRGTAWYGDGARGAHPWSLLVSATGLHSEGGEMHYADAGTERNTDWDRSGGLTVRAERGPIAVLASGYARRHGTIAGAFGSTFGDDRSFTEDTRGVLDVVWSAVRREAVGVRLRAYGDYYRFEDSYRYDPSPVFRDHATAMWGGAEGVVTWSTRRNRLVVSVEGTGGEVRQDAFEKEGEGTLPPDPEAPPNDVPVDVHRFEVFRGTVHDALELFDGVKLEAGAYVESHALYGIAAAPRAGLVAQLPAKSTVKALYGRGFRSPSIYETYFDDGLSVTGNEDLAAETADVAELAVEKSLNARADLFLSAFHGEYRDLMVRELRDLDPAPGAEDLRGQFVNAGVARSSGATAAVQVRLERVALWLDATAFRHDEDGGFSVTQGAPEWVGHTMALVDLGRGMTLGARASAVGARSSREPGRRLPPYVLADVSILAPLGSGFSARVSGTNLLAADVRHAAAEEYTPREIPGYGPRAFFELRWER